MVLSSFRINVRNEHGAAEARKIPPVDQRTDRKTGKHSHRDFFDKVVGPNVSPRRGVRAHLQRVLITLFRCSLASLFNSVCPSVRLSIGKSVGDAFVKKNPKNVDFFFQQIKTQRHKKA